VTTGAPRTAWQLGLLGLVPMIWGVAELYLAPVRSFSEAWLNPAFYGPFAPLRYASIILAFMSGVFWGFAAKADGKTAALCYKLSVLPALYTYLFVLGEPENLALKLASGFALILGLDHLFAQKKLTPDWWMQLRVALTAVMVLCLVAIAFAPATPVIFGG